VPHPPPCEYLEIVFGEGTIRTGEASPARAQPSYNSGLALRPRYRAVLPFGTCGYAARR
jgi:hypothetical protein